MLPVEYGAIARACDRLLTSADATLETAAVSWLHVHNEHPVNVQKYTALGSTVPLVQRILREARRSRAATLVRSYLPPGGTALSGAVGPVDVLFVSHLLNEDQAGASDFYFGDLPELLQAQGISTAVALRNHTGAAPQALAAAWTGRAVPRIVLGSTLSARGELELRRRMAVEARRLLAASPADGEDPLERQVRQAAAREALSFASRGDLRLHGQVRELVSRLAPRAVVVTFEGHGWERLAFHAAREARPGIRCIGYHHTILFPQQHAIRRSLGPAFDPEVILTVGEVTREVLTEAFPGGTPRIEILGSVRAPGALAGAPAVPHGASPACLVIPDGTVPESLRVFSFAVECARLAEETRFIFRTHPVLPFRAVAAAARELQKLPPNVEVSTRPITEDIARSGWALYRGSSAVLPAVLGGVRPLYLHAPGELPIDPLHRMADWRRIVEQPGEVLHIIGEDSARMSPDPAARVAFEFCSRYILPLRPDVLLQVVNGRGASTNA